MRLLVCGGRDFTDRAFLYAVLDFARDEAILALDPITTLIQGGQVTTPPHGPKHGADYLAKCWAEERDLAVEEFPADWGTHGRAAGPIRNQAMIDKGKPDMVIAFAGGRGTADMLRRVKAAGIPFREMRPKLRPEAANPNQPEKAEK